MLSGRSESRWYAANDVESLSSSDEGESKYRKMVSRCSVCEVERTLLAVHSGSTHNPECPPRWNTLWSGFSYISASVSDIASSHHY